MKQFQIRYKEDGALSDAKIVLTCTIFEYGTTQARILQFPFLE